MAYQSTFAHPYQVTPAPTAYTIATAANVSLTSPFDVTVTFNTWLDKPSWTAGKLPIAQFSQKFANQSTIAANLQGQLDTAVIGGGVPTLGSPSVVA